MDLYADESDRKPVSKCPCSAPCHATIASLTNQIAALTSKVVNAEQNVVQYQDEFERITARYTSMVSEGKDLHKAFMAKSALVDQLTNQLRDITQAKEAQVACVHACMSACLSACMYESIDVCLFLFVFEKISFL